MLWGFSWSLLYSFLWNQNAASGFHRKKHEFRAHFLVIKSSSRGTHSSSLLRESGNTIGFSACRAQGLRHDFLQVSRSKCALLRSWQGWSEAVLRFEPESSCLGCTIFVTILWFSVRKRKEKAENSSPQTTPQSRMATLFLKRVSAVDVNRGQNPPPPKNPTPLGATQIDKGLSTKASPCYLWRRLPRCAVCCGRWRPPGWQLTAVCIPARLLLEFFPWYSSPCPFLIFFSFLAYHSFAFFLEVCRGNQRRLKHNKNHLHLSQALRYLSQLWWKTRERKLLAKIRAQTRSVDHL